MPGEHKAPNVPRIGSGRSVPQSTLEAPTEKPLHRMNKASLQAIARELGISEEGTNKELVARIEKERNK